MIEKPIADPRPWYEKGCSGNGRRAEKRLLSKGVAGKIFQLALEKVINHRLTCLGFKLIKSHMENPKYFIIKKSNLHREFCFFTGVYLPFILCFIIILGMIFIEGLKWNIALLYFVVLFVFEYYFRIILKRRPQEIWFEDDCLFLCYYFGFLKIKYLKHNCSLLPSTNNEEYLRVKIKGWLFPIIISKYMYSESNIKSKKLNIIDLISIPFDVDGR